jgi:quercetin dioxygenase-like cupin family protein
MTAIVSGDPGRADNPRRFLDGSRRSVMVLKSVSIGRGRYLPGWRWSQHASPQTGKPSQAHIGYVLSGQMVIRTSDGEQVTINPGEAFEVEAGHDAWVLGDEPCVALDFESGEETKRV